jgi:hypothetical protein
LNPTWNLIAPLLALAVVIVTMQLFVALAGAIRSRDYRRFENRSAERIRKEFHLPRPDSRTGEERRDAFAAHVDKLHETANRAQTVYHDAVARSSACLALGFAALAGSTLSPGDWPVLLRFQRLPWQLFLGCTDTLALVLVLILFLHGKSRYCPWIIRRADTELARQYQYLSVLFPATFPVTDKFETPAVRAAKSESKRHLLDHLTTQIEKLWHERKAQIEHLAAARPHIDHDVLVFYLRKRVLRQIGWFTDSVARLEHIAGRRRIVLLVLYIATVVLAPVQLGCLLTHKTLPMIRPALLIITGLSLAMTAYYTNQNLGSIVHRYNVQVREIRCWLRDMLVLLKDCDTAHFAQDPGTIKMICARIVAFEELMIYELIDWINISGHDVIELG